MFWSGKLMNKSLFDERARAWDSPGRVALAEAVSGAMMEDVPFGSDMTAVDFGAGTGLVTLSLAPLVRRIIAVDSSEKMLESMKEKMELLGVKNVDTLFTGHSSAAFLSLQADCLVSSMTFHHVEDTASLCGNIYSILAPGGFVAVADLDLEDGTFHPDNTGVYHPGFDEETIKGHFSRAGFHSVSRRIVHSIQRKRDGRDRSYQVFLLTARK
jgi:ubiquinone/menaquinone biosynthesis C-methylase UbiE